MKLTKRSFIKGTAAGALTMAAGRGFAADKTYTIALSNGWVGSEWRTQMIEESIAAAESWKDAGIDVTVEVQSKNVDVQGQIADVRNFMNQGVDAIIVNPNSPSAFNPTFAQAKARGTIVLATDGEVTSPDAAFVGINQKEWAMLSSRWLAEQLGGQGKIVTVNGIAGHPANQARVEGYTEVFAEYPGIEILNEANADWDVAKAQQVTQTLLATYPEIDGVWTHDGHAEGVWRALDSAGRTSDIVATGELRASFVRDWKSQGWNTAASINPPGCMANAVHVALHMLEGRELKDGVMAGPNGNGLYVPTKLITNAELDEVTAELEGKPDYAFVSLVLSKEEIGDLFFK
jgi:ribose transport system substrate-binding protein